MAAHQTLAQPHCGPHRPNEPAENFLNLLQNFSCPTAIALAARVFGFPSSVCDNPFLANSLALKTLSTVAGSGHQPMDNMENTVVSVEAFAIPRPPPGWNYRYGVHNILQSSTAFEFWTELDVVCQRAISRGCPPLSFDMDLVMSVWYRHEGKPLKRPAKRERRNSCPFPTALQYGYRSFRLSPPGPRQLEQNEYPENQVPPTDEQAEEKFPTWLPALRKLIIRRFCQRHVGLPTSPQPNPRCTICFEKLQIVGVTEEEILMEQQRGETVEREPAALLACGHIVGKNCIEAFRQTEADAGEFLQCPECRFDLLPQGCFHHLLYPIRDISHSDREFFLLEGDICPDLDSLEED